MAFTKHICEVWVVVRKSTNEIRSIHDNEKDAELACNRAPYGHIVKDGSMEY